MDTWCTQPEGTQTHRDRKRAKESNDKESYKAREFFGTLQHKFLQDNQEGSAARKTFEIRKIREQEKIERLREVQGYKKNFGQKLIGKNINVDKNEYLTMKTRKRLERNEARMNYWSCYREVTRLTKPAGKTKI